MKMNSNFMWQIHIKIYVKYSYFIQTISGLDENIHIELLIGSWNIVVVYKKRHHLVGLITWTAKQSYRFAVTELARANFSIQTKLRTP